MAQGWARCFGAGISSPACCQRALGRSSVSAEPPLLLVCVNRNNLASKAIDQNGCFCVDVIEAEQQQVA